MNVCKACGKKTMDEDIFCPECGARLDTKLKSPQEIRRKSKVSKLVKWVFIIILVIIFLNALGRGNIGAAIISLILITLLVWALKKKRT